MNVSRIGVFNKTHGYDGEINLTVEVPFDYEECRFIFAKVNGLLVPFEINSVREKNDNTLLVSFHRMDEARSQMFVKQDAYIDDKYICNDEEEMNAAYYVGHRIENEKGEFIGSITDYDDSTENILFSVEGADGNDHFIPAAAIEIIEVTDKVIKCALPEGLMEL